MIIAFSQSNKGLPLQLHKARRTCASCIHLFPSERVNPALCLSLRFFFIHPFIHGETEAFVHTHVGIFKNTFFSASREIIIITEKKNPSKPRVKEKKKISETHKEICRRWEDAKTKRWPRNLPERGQVGQSGSLKESGSIRNSTTQQQQRKGGWHRKPHVFSCVAE